MTYELLSQIAKRTGRHKETIRRYFKAGKIRGYRDKLNGYIYIEAEDINKKIKK